MEQDGWRLRYSDAGTISDWSFSAAADAALVTFTRHKVGTWAHGEHHQGGGGGGPLVPNISFNIIQI